MRIIWTAFAIDTLKSIVEYHKEVANPKVAVKIRKEIFSSTGQLLKYPESGQTELLLKHLNENYRYILSGNYKVIYKIIKNDIVITDIFDTRQNPTKIDRSQE
ncbi:type II toxin-antitoxin system RelE/ParE family toxin [Antarcticibacterium flavum]|uniref:Type II toxin-antitoxin system RelE/ParE family toxin n=1 Tax=Antarcticibacterium flavum TaxID=2058175 RepID=A0A5B7X0R7_9FLAO|nr:MULTISPECIES: type II toxin-antitoxin system RelE/ParE family toxin [Antarcticibacterium]MCM4161623.1 type II toxin-antitoxin system RelE/ParE family toxin [Antarcticibacterium sp. W02-3]QCY68939.1 type II toxin-antitoxin system RelE/ParE family toxin [Antarcticibacterium flavum]